MASITISPSLDLAAIAEAAGQPDVEKRHYADGKLYVEGVTQQALDDAAAAYDPLPGAKARKLADILRAYEAEAQAIKAGYPETEVLSWDKQEKEARAYQGDPTAPTPFLDALAAARQIDKAELVTRVMAKVDAADDYIGTITGKRQRLEGLINDAQTVAEVEAISLD